jgi:hypothetical protein
MVVVFQHGLCPWIAESLRQAGSIKLSHAIDRITALQPGVLTSLLGSPFFLYLLLRQGRSAREF